MRKDKAFLFHGTYLLVLCFYALITALFFCINVPTSVFIYLNNNFISGGPYIFYKVLILVAALCCVI
jgi:hypothetical protein